MSNTGFPGRIPIKKMIMHVYPDYFEHLLSLTWFHQPIKTNLSPKRSHRPLHQKLVPIPLAVYVDVNSHGRFEIHNKVHNKFTKTWNRRRHTIYQDYTAKKSHSANQCFSESVYQSGSPKSLINHSVSGSACQPPDSRGNQVTSHSVSQWISWQVLGKSASLL